MTLRALIDRAGAEPVKAVLLGGAAGLFVAPDDLDLPLTFEDTRAAGATLGSGVVMLFDDRADLHRHRAAHRVVLPSRVLRSVRAVPRRAPSGRRRRSIASLQGDRAAPWRTRSP